MDIRIAIVEDDTEIRESLGLIINSAEGFVCDHLYANAELAIEDIMNHPINVVLMDIELPGKSGIEMTVKTNQPAMVVYTPPSLDYLQFIDGANYGKYPAICFETQKFPDAPNNTDFPSTLLSPGDIYKNETILTFKNI